MLSICACVGTATQGMASLDRIGISCRTLVLLMILPLCIPFFSSNLLSKLSAPSSQGNADTIFSNAVIYTSDAKLPWAESMAVRKGRIVRIGKRAYVQAMAGPQTQHVDLQGRFVVPGFVDSHVHFIAGGLQMAQVDLRDARKITDFISKIKVAVKGARMGQWILGSGWNNENWGGELPSSSWIDPFTQHNPVWLSRMDGHMGLGNSVALGKAGIEESTRDPEGGSIVKHKDGGLTGILVDSAMRLVMDLIPEPSVEERRKALVRASKHALSKGVTAVVDFGRYIPGVSTTKVWDDYHEVYKWADSVGSMFVRVSTFFPLETWKRVADTINERGQESSQWLRIGGLKAFADGSLGSNSALFHQSYEDDPGNFGLEAANPVWMLDAITEADKSNVQIAVHAIGDAANDRVLSAFEAVVAVNGPRDRRFRIEHAQHLSSEAPARFGSLGIIASVQPEHILDDALYAAKKLGEERSLKQSYLFNSLLKNTTLALGSDWPVAPLDPLGGIIAATRRTPIGWEAPWIPSECIDIEAAVTGYTLSAAYASFRDNDIGSLSCGKLADFVILSGDLFTDSDELSVLATYAGGIAVFNQETPNI